jgi:hypothetical protein
MKCARLDGLGDAPIEGARSADQILNDVITKFPRAPHVSAREAATRTPCMDNRHVGASVRSSSQAVNSIAYCRGRELCRRGERA